MEFDNYDSREKGKFIASKEFPAVPFQIVLIDKEYCKRYCLPVNTLVTVTNVRYSIERKEIRYSLLDAMFDFPWNEDSCEILFIYSTN